MRFQLKAISPDGRVESLALQAADEAGARRQAEGRGYTVLQVRGWQGFALGRERFPVVLFSQELVALLDAGLPLLEAIETLGEKERTPALKNALDHVAATLREGRPFSSALEKLGELFPPLYIATVRAAERTSDLQPALTRYVSYQAQVDALKRRVIHASIYPALLIGVGALVGLFLLLYVVPRFSLIYEERAVDLPLLSRLLLSWGQFVEHHGLFVVIGLFLVILLCAYLLSRPATQAHLQNALWRLPGAGERMKLYQLARFYRTIGMLLRGGMPVVAALQLGAELLHPALRGRLQTATRAIREGRPVSESMEANGLTTPVALRLLAVGEHGGDMGAMMERIAAFHDDEMARWVDWLTRLVEPLLMAAIGLVIGAIVILMYMPIFELAGAVT
ncbi:MAG TPA: type II secretion system F family protein [Burkholderiales bacterium]|nr:type II secretion system F family protein [Burkholderiales bacterium]